jgi:hypothetical protein
MHKAMSIGNVNVTLTAHVLITLEEASPILQVSIYPSMDQICIHVEIWCNISMSTTFGFG